MSKTPETAKDAGPSGHLQVPTKAEILDALTNDSSRGGLQLEWMLDRCTQRDGRGQ